MARFRTSQIAQATVLAADYALGAALARFRTSNRTSDGFGIQFTASKGPGKPCDNIIPVQKLYHLGALLSKPNEVRVVVPKPSLVHFPASFSAKAERNAIAPSKSCIHQWALIPPMREEIRDEREAMREKGSSEGKTTSFWVGLLCVGLRLFRMEPGKAHLFIPIQPL